MSIASGALVILNICVGIIPPLFVALNIIKISADTLISIEKYRPVFAAFFDYAPTILTQYDPGDCWTR